MKSQSHHFERPTEFAHALIRERLKAGDRAIDATAGNGHDTFFLAQCVGEGGMVFAFDLQKEAIERTGERCSDLSQVRLICEGHEKIRDLIDEPIDAVMFNLGYLPSGDKSVITRSETSVLALDAALELLNEGGILTCVLYTGHPGGEEEALAVEQWFSARDQDTFSVIQYSFVNQRNSPPHLLALQRNPNDTVL